ncbi:hypothetical protein NXS19_004085 [Fusarium pseudograminearum]|nr:hypothetical protein NXS19_004085 [Fusarium pseudograminearum]
MPCITSRIKTFLSGSSSLSSSASQYDPSSEKHAQSYQLQTVSQSDATPPPPPYSSTPSCDQSLPKPFILEFEPPSQQGYRVSRPLDSNGQRFIYLQRTRE